MGHIGQRIEQYQTQENGFNLMALIRSRQVYAFVFNLKCESIRIAGHLQIDDF